MNFAWPAPVLLALPAPEETIRRAAKLMDDMGDIQVRRVPVVSRDDHKLVGIVAMADLARNEAMEGRTVETLRDISSPVPPM
ncbi:CBS domain-containing protein [Rugamonas sp. A1-17]|nr:CBS domain-containing protein [Rugamonas sp. A1-17]